MAPFADVTPNMAASSSHDAHGAMRLTEPKRRDQQADLVILPSPVDTRLIGMTKRWAERLALYTGDAPDDTGRAFVAWTKTLPGDPKLESSMLHGPQYGEKKIAWQMPKRWKRAEAKRQRSESAESPDKRR